MILHQNTKTSQNLILKIFCVPRGTLRKGDDKMKQNTKFLWMYICILFSFAIILIIFAGLSTNEEKGLENKVEKVSSENNALKKENTTLKNSIKSKDEAIATANQNYTQLNSEKEVVEEQNSN